MFSQEAQQNSLMDMEMADYERLVKELNGKLADKDEHVKDLKTQINTLTQKQEAFKKEIGLDHFIILVSLNVHFLQKKIVIL